MELNEREAHCVARADISNTPKSVFDVAKYILEKQSSMSTWKLQKLCYYAQAWHYTWTEGRLIKEEFQAWRGGAVCAELRKYLAGKFMIRTDDVTSSIAPLTDDEKKSVDVVLKDYGNREPYDLREQSHFEEPYRKARGNLPPDANCENIISVESMGEYYGSLIYGQSNE